MHELWTLLFGKLWCEYASMFRNAGSFVLNKNSTDVYADDNTVSMLGMKDRTDYDTLNCALKDVQSDCYDDGVNISVVYSDEAGNIAGFVTLSDTIPVAYNDLPLCSRLEIVSQLVKNEEHSYLTMISLGKYGNVKISLDDISLVLTGILSFSNDILISAIDESKFWLYDHYDGDYSDRLTDLQKYVKLYSSKNNNHATDVMFSAGYTRCVGSSNICMRNAEFALYESLSKGHDNISAYSEEMFAVQKDRYDLVRKFDKLVDNNMFIYHYQPIVDVQNGNIVAYEALMRTDPAINMNPLQILEVARSVNKLYDIEKATLRNTLKAVSENQHIFENRKLFVNSIPSHFLTHSDWADLASEYDSFLRKIVLEMTEESELDDESLVMIKNRLCNNNIGLAIDDYGTGYSNTINLLRYGPDYVKIDRSLIDHINEKPKVQKLISGIVEFIHQNGYFALAEGVETRDELKTVISLGVDLVQGYYIAKPQAVFLKTISPDIANDMIHMSANNTSFGKLYHPSENELINLSELAAEHYTGVVVNVNLLTVVGDPDILYNCPFIIKDNVLSEIVFNNVRITTDKSMPVIDIGVNSELHLIVKGNNEIVHYGIHVPDTALFDLSGDGNLRIASYSADTYGIGVSSTESYGSICINNTGKLSIKVGGERAIAIGGGHNEKNKVIKICNGSIDIECSGGFSVGIGCLYSNSIVDILKCALDIHMAANDSVAIGSFTDGLSISLSNYAIILDLSGVNVCGLGSLKNGTGSIRLNSGSIEGNFHSRNITGIGCHEGDIDYSVKASRINLYCEGGYATCIGSSSNIGNIVIIESSVEFTALCQTGQGICTTGVITDRNTAYDININP